MDGQRASLLRRGRGMETEANWPPSHELLIT
jgi:hypothetical protein